MGFTVYIYIYIYIYIYMYIYIYIYIYLYIYIYIYIYKYIYIHYVFFIPTCCPMGRVCNIHTFVDRSKFCPTKVTFVRQKSLLSDKSNFVYDKSITFVYDKIIFVRQNLILSDKSNFVLTKMASVNKSNFVIDKITFVDTKLLLCYTWRDHSPSVTFRILS